MEVESGESESEESEDDEDEEEEDEEAQALLPSAQKPVVLYFLFLLTDLVSIIMRATVLGKKCYRVCILNSSLLERCSITLCFEEDTLKDIVITCKGHLKFSCC